MGLNFNKVPIGSSDEVDSGTRQCGRLRKTHCDNISEDVKAFCLFSGHTEFSLMVRLPVLAGELSLSCARLMTGRVTTLWLKRPLSVNQHGQLSQPSLGGR